MVIINNATRDLRQLILFQSDSALFCSFEERKVKELRAIVAGIASENDASCFALKRQRKSGLDQE